MFAGMCPLYTFVFACFLFSVDMEHRFSLIVSYNAIKLMSRMILIPSGKLNITMIYGKTQSLIGKSTIIQWPFSIGILTKAEAINSSKMFPIVRCQTLLDTWNFFQRISRKYPPGNMTGEKAKR